MRRDEFRQCPAFRSGSDEPIIRNRRTTCAPRRALAFHFVRAARDIPALDDFLQEAVAQKPFPARA
jgi:hypothetical protein